MKQGSDLQLGWMQWLVRLCVSGLFALAIISKLVDPGQFLSPLQGGLGFSELAASVFFVATVLVLSILVALLLFKKSGLGLLLSGVFFIAGAAYSVILDQNLYAGGCGCGVSAAPGAANQLVVHAYQNSACAVFCLFLGFRARLGGDLYDEEANEED